eukprot:8790690-Ditylum_brightwellii.AAC.1
MNRWRIIGLVWGWIDSHIIRKLYNVSTIWFVFFFVPRPICTATTVDTATTAAAKAATNAVKAAAATTSSGT